MSVQKRKLCTTKNPWGETMKKSASHKLRRFTMSRLPLAAAIHLACFAPVFADTDPEQNTPATQAPGADDQNKTHELGTITVTAQKRTENLQDVPISLDVLN